MNPDIFDRIIRGKRQVKIKMLTGDRGKQRILARIEIKFQKVSKMINFLKLFLGKNIRIGKVHCTKEADSV